MYESFLFHSRTDCRMVVVLIYVVSYDACLI